jgi:Flp pilus assembly protein TadD
MAKDSETLDRFPSSLALATEILLALGYASRFRGARKRVGRSTVMRARAGDRVSTSRHDLLTEVVELILPPTVWQAAIPAGVSPEPLVVQLERTCEWYDRTASELTRSTDNRDERRFAMLVLLRFVALDMSIRIAAYLQLSAVELPATPAHPLLSGRPFFNTFTRIIDEAGLTLDRIEREGVAAKATVQRWREGELPHREGVIEHLAAKLVHLKGADTPIPIEQRLRWARAVAHFRGKLLGLVGARGIDDLIAGCWQVVLAAHAEMAGDGLADIVSAQVSLMSEEELKERIAGTAKRLEGNDAAPTETVAGLRKKFTRDPAVRTFVRLQTLFAIMGIGPKGSGGESLLRKVGERVADGGIGHDLQVLPGSWDIRLQWYIHMFRGQSGEELAPIRRDFERRVLFGGSPDETLKLTMDEMLKHATAESLSDEAFEQVLPAVQTMLAMFLTGQGDNDSAAEAVRDLGGSIGSFMRGLVNIQKGNRSAALNDFFAYTTAEPANARGWSLLGWLMTSVSDEAAEPYLMHSLIIDPHHYGTMRMLAECRLKMGRPTEAADLLRPVVKATPNDGAAWAFLAQAEAALGRPREAREAAREAQRWGFPDALKPLDGENWDGK